MQDQNKRHHPLDINTLKGHGDSVNGLCFSPDGRNLATGRLKWFYFYLTFFVPCIKFLTFLQCQLLLDSNGLSLQEMVM